MPLDHDAVVMGEALRERRKELGLTLKELAALSGLSHPFISLVERGRARPSLPSFTSLARALDSTPIDLLAAINPPLHPPSASSIEGNVSPDGATVTRAGTPAPSYVDGSGQVLISAPGQVRVMEIRSQGEPTDVRLSHDDADEYLYVLEGSVLVFVDGRRYVLEAGDTIRIPVGSSHNWWTNSGMPYRLLMTSVPLLR